MKSTYKFLLATLAAGIFAAALVSGCAAIKTAADDVAYVTNGTEPATTQPTSQPTTKPAGLVVAHDVVTVTKTIYPPIAPILSLVGVLAAGIGTVAGNWNGKSKGAAQVKQATDAITEIVGDVASFKAPSTAWSSATETILNQLGHTEAATPAPANG